MSEFKNLYEGDLDRYSPGNRTGWVRRFHYYLRKTQTCGKGPLRIWYHFWFRTVSGAHRMEISYKAAIGKGLCLENPYTVTINSNAVLGDDVTLGKGITIGKQNRGALAGSPVIGNRVHVGDNAVVVGKIRIGDDAVIAPNAYVNRDVPAASFVSGNPCVIISEFERRLNGV